MLVNNLAGRPETQRPRISLVGLGKLGSPMAACFAARGFDVTGVDANSQILELMRHGKAPVFEPHLEEMLKRAEGRLHVTDDFERAILESDVTFIVVATPSDEHGGFSLRYVEPVCEKVAATLSKKSGFHVVVLTSTVLPGSMDNAVRPLLEKKTGKKAGVDFGLCYNPEFIALGTVVRDFLNPDFLLIGESDSRSGDLLVSIYEDLCENTPKIARMNWVNAEMTKLSVNTYVTTKLTFANMLAHICERLPGADVDAVTAALGMDSRIGSKYLKGAVGYGGPCFPRDNLALSYLARELGVPAILAEATDRANRLEVGRLVEMACARLKPGGTVGVLGLSYKPETNVVDESQGLLLARALLERGVRTVAYDPAAAERAAKAVPQLTMAPSAAECVTQSDVVVVATPWPEFKALEPANLEACGKSRTLIDCWRMLDAGRFQPVCEYVAVGIGCAAGEQ